MAERRAAALTVLAERLWMSTLKLRLGEPPRNRPARQSQRPPPRPPPPLALPLLPWMQKKKGHNFPVRIETRRVRVRPQSWHARLWLQHRRPQRPRHHHRLYGTKFSIQPPTIITGTTRKPRKAAGRRPWRQCRPHNLDRNRFPVWFCSLTPQVCFRSQVRRSLRLVP